MFLLLAFTALAIAVARPLVEVRVPRRTATVLVAIDVSRSMRADRRGAGPGRGRRLRRPRFVADLPAEFNVGLVAFAGRLAVRAAPTTDRKEVEAAL